MRLVRKLLGFSLLAAGVVYLRGRRLALRTARGADVRFDDNFGTSAPANENLVEVATQSATVGWNGFSRSFGTAYA